jgi:hypothetical protein
MNDYTYVSERGDDGQRQGDTTIIDGGGSRFVVEYQYDQNSDAASRSPDVEVKGGNNEFVVNVDGSTGGSDITIDGGNNKFVVVFDNASGGNNSVHINGGNNQFVVRFDYASGQGQGDVVTVDGANNQYVVQTSSAGEVTQVAAAGPGGGFGTLPGGQDAASTNGGVYDQSPSNTQHGDTKTDASHSQDAERGDTLPDDADSDVEPNGAKENENMRNDDMPSNATNDGHSSGSGANGNPFTTAGGAGGNPFGGGESGGQSTGGGFGNPAGGRGGAGGNPFGGGQSGGESTGGGGFGNMAGGAGGNPFGGGESGGQSAGGSSGNMAGGADLDSLIAQSPFGRLLDLPGIDGAEDIFGNVQGNFGGGNPFAGLGSTPGSNPFAGLGGRQDGSDPRAGGDGSNPFAGSGNDQNNPDYDFSAFRTEGGADTWSEDGMSNLASSEINSDEARTDDFGSSRPESDFSPIA